MVPIAVPVPSSALALLLLGLVGCWNATRVASIGVLSYAGGLNMEIGEDKLFHGFLGFFLFVGARHHRFDVFERIGLIVASFAVDDADCAGNDVHRIHGVVAVWSMDDGPDLGEVLFLDGIGVVFVGKAANQFAAGAGKLRDVQSEHLVFGPCDGDAFELGQEGGAA